MSIHDSWIPVETLKRTENRAGSKAWVRIATGCGCGCGRIPSTGKEELRPSELSWKLCCLENSPRTLGSEGILGRLEFGSTEATYRTNPMLVTVALPSSTEGTYLLKHSQQAPTDTSSLATSNFLAEQKRGCGKAFVDLRSAEIASNTVAAFSGSETTFIALHRTLFFLSPRGLVIPGFSLIELTPLWLRFSYKDIV
uniref:Uncharacterized protein n=1 Tax=Vespula pensylvanica TaxID=30213 RepID=A0A834KIV9_VESPE|nr:hypothetical protein H0235_014393 [Vespula pensylvanica]